MVELGIRDRWPGIDDVLKLAVTNVYPDFLYLHAASCARDGKGYVLVGPSTSGKSTLLLGLAEIGFRVLTEDMTTIDTVSCSIVPMAEPWSRLKGQTWHGVEGLRSIRIYFSNLACPAISIARGIPIEGIFLLRPEGGVPTVVRGYDEWIKMSKAVYGSARATSEPRHVTLLAHSPCDFACSPEIRQISKLQALKAMLPLLYPTCLSQGVRVSKAIELLAVASCVELKPGHLTETVRRIHDYLGSIQ